MNHHADLAAWTRQLDCLLCDEPPDRAEPYRLLFAEMALALIRERGRREALIQNTFQRIVLAWDDLRELLHHDHRFPQGRHTLPAEGIAPLLQTRRKP